MKMFDPDNEKCVEITEAQKSLVLESGIASEEDGDVDRDGDLVLGSEQYDAAIKVLEL